MKKTPVAKKTHKTSEAKKSYRLERGKVSNTRRAKDAALFVMIDPDVAKVFATESQVNHALRALITAVPEKRRRAAAGLSTVPKRRKKEDAERETALKELSAEFAAWELASSDALKNFEDDLDKP